jgi:hypothetical protein
MTPDTINTIAMVTLMLIVVVPFAALFLFGSLRGSSRKQRLFELLDHVEETSTGSRTEYTLAPDGELGATTLVTHDGAIGPFATMDVHGAPLDGVGEEAITLKNTRAAGDVALPGYVGVFVAAAQVERALEVHPERLRAFQDFVETFRLRRLDDGTTSPNTFTWLLGSMENLLSWTSPGISDADACVDTLAEMRRVAGETYTSHRPRRPTARQRWELFLDPSARKERVQARREFLGTLTYGLAPDAVRAGVHDDLILETIASYGPGEVSPGVFAVLSAILMERTPEEALLAAALEACSEKQAETFIQVIKARGGLEPRHVTLLHALRARGQAWEVNLILKKAQGAGDLSLAQPAQGGEVSLSVAAGGELEQVDEVALDFSGEDAEARAEDEVEEEAEVQG